jgi:hypothetical protein
MSVMNSRRLKALHLIAGDYTLPTSLNESCVVQNGKLTR